MNKTDLLLHALKETMYENMTDEEIIKLRDKQMRQSKFHRDIDPLYDLWNTRNSKDEDMSYIKGLEDQRFELQQNLAEHCMDCFSPDKMDEPCSSNEFQILYNLTSQLIEVEAEIEDYNEETNTH